jgi:endonuclease/exonuclease/phosphatase family metal-dependent hydrolase
MSPSVAQPPALWPTSATRRASAMPRSTRTSVGHRRQRHAVAERGEQLRVFEEDLERVEARRRAGAEDPAGIDDRHDRQLLAGDVSGRIEQPAGQRRAGRGPIFDRLGASGRDLADPGVAGPDRRLGLAWSAEQEGRADRGIVRGPQRRSLRRRRRSQCGRWGGGRGRGLHGRAGSRVDVSNCRAPVHRVVDRLPKRVRPEERVDSRRVDGRRFLPVGHGAPVGREAGRMNGAGGERHDGPGADVDRGEARQGLRLVGRRLIAPRVEHGDDRFLGRTGALPVVGDVASTQNREVERSVRSSLRVAQTEHDVIVVGPQGTGRVDRAVGDGEAIEFSRRRAAPGPQPRVHRRVRVDREEDELSVVGRPRRPKEADDVARGRRDHAQPGGRRVDDGDLCRRDEWREPRARLVNLHRGARAVRRPRDGADAREPEEIVGPHGASLGERIGRGAAADGDSENELAHGGRHASSDVSVDELCCQAVRYDARVPATTIALGAALIILGLGGYGLTGATSLTALIPAGFGLLFVLAGLLARDDRRRMHTMHAAVVLALLGFLGSVRGLLRIADVFHPISVRPAAIVAQSIMAVLTLAYIVIAVRSFVRARRAKRAAGSLLLVLCAAPAMANDLRVMTYNIKHGQTNAICTQAATTPDQPPAPDCNLDLQAAMGVIREHNPDIVGLQEVDRFWARSGYADQPEALRAALGMKHACYAANLVHPADSHADRPHQYGTLILSRHPIGLCSNTLLPRTGENEQRGFTLAVIDVRGVTLRFYNTHLHTTAADRLLQTAYIAPALDSATPELTVVVGDFNARPTAAELEPLFGRLTDAWAKARDRAADDADGLTSPAALGSGPKHRIDYAFVSPSIDVRAARVFIDAKTRLASDHYPVVVDLTLPAAKPARYQRQPR